MCVCVRACVCVCVCVCTYILYIYTYYCPCHTTCLHRNYDKALGVLQRATAMPARKAAYHDASEAVQHRLYKNLKVWAMYADLEESLGTFEVRGERERGEGARGLFVATNNY